MPSKQDLDFLREVVETQHHCRATYVRTDEVVERYGGVNVWAGWVSVFNIDRPDSDTCYAWSSPVEGSAGRRYYAVLKIPPVDSPIAAVRASIVRDHRA